MIRFSACIAVACSAALGTLITCCVGCVGQDTRGRQRTLEVADAAGLRAYFRRLKPGYPLAKIEAELSLPEPLETGAPAFGWPFWKYLYKKGSCYIRVWVDGSGPGRKDMVFQGEWYVYTDEEYHKARIPIP